MSKTATVMPGVLEIKGFDLQVYCNAMHLPMHLHASACVTMSSKLCYYPDVTQGVTQRQQ